MGYLSYKDYFVENVFIYVVSLHCWHLWDEIKSYIHILALHYYTQNTQKVFDILMHAKQNKRSVEWAWKVNWLNKHKKDSSFWA